MPRSELPPSYGHYCTEVEGMLAASRRLGAVERMLERAPHPSRGALHTPNPRRSGRFTRPPDADRAQMSTADRSRKRSPRESEGEIRRTRTEGARRAIRARQSKDVRDDRRSFGRPRELGQRSFPGGARVARVAERVKHLNRSGT